ncbi:VOC family protein [Ferrimonas sediminicola]|uniref:VOC family protein n=1 Tax=Ferrimonas sediminicola TaxID=2569538 RepID=A0A4U1BB14_9GAMM|nr:VOC family protein [Ferrimonas sediminicola]TKB47358.1 VOC family protein [Ferrimonas sediminicola]
MSDFNTIYNRAVWFDIPVANLDRAAAFYSKVLGIGVTLDEVEGRRFAVLEHELGNGGCLVVDEIRVSSQQGILIYLNVDGRIGEAVEQVTNMGGTVLQGVHSLGPYGFRALILDSEGNCLALHAQRRGV